MIGLLMLAREVMRGAQRPVRLRPARGPGDREGVERRLSPSRSFLRQPSSGRKRSFGETSETPSRTGICTLQTITSSRSREASAHVGDGRAPQNTGEAAPRAVVRGPWTIINGRTTAEHK